MNGHDVVWTWDLLNAQGSAADEPAPLVHSRFDAEAWLGENWRALAGRGVRTAVLRRAGEPVAAPVELRAFE